MTAPAGVTLDGELIASGHVYAAINGNIYILTLEDAGRWRGIYRAVRQSVPLGSLDESVVLDRLEGGDWLLGEGGCRRQWRDELVAANGSVFTLRRSGDRRWRAQYRVVTVNVPLGETGRVATRERSEHATWWIGASDLKCRVWAIGTYLFVTNIKGVSGCGCIASRASATSQPDSCCTVPA